MQLHVARSRDLVELVVLGLLAEVPRHPYEMLRQLKLRGNTAFVRGLPRSLYHAVDQLVSEGSVIALESAREGTRPERTTYDVSAAGHAEFRQRLRHLLETPSDQSTFHAALSMMAGLTRDDSVASLEVRVAAIDAHVAVTEGVLREALTRLPRLVLVEVEYLRGQLVAEAEWVRTIIANAGSGDLSWELEFGPHADAPAP